MALWIFQTLPDKLYSSCRKKNNLCLALCRVCNDYMRGANYSYTDENFALMEAFGLRRSDVGDVQVGAVDAPVGGEVLHCVALDVSLHGDQAAAKLQAHRALVWRGPAVSPQVLDHG